MCGICGIINLDGKPVLQPALDRMTDVLSHRGPDGRGTLIDGNVGLGHRRLKIIDLSDAGAQPMVTQDGRYSIVYNGEVYNYQTLRKTLEEKRFSFKSRTDTEVILKAYAEWGPSCVERFNGMFAFAVWDNKERALFLARDRYGIKPLYYAFHKGTFYFASEQKAILALDFPCDIDLEGLVEYFTFQNFFTNKTLLKGIRTFPAGSWTLLSVSSPALSDVDFSPVKFWDFDFAEPETPSSEAEYIEELNHLFNQAVQRQLISDVGVNAYLSGGMDSGAITAIASQHVPSLKTFTCGFDLSSATGLELGFDERKKSQAMSARFKTDHHERVLKAGDMEKVLPKLAWHLEEPRVGQSYPNYYAAELASRFGKVVLAGTGGDELFGGYPWRYYRAAVNSNFTDYIDKYYAFWQRLLPNGTTKKVFQPVWDQVKHVDTKSIFQSVFQQHADQLTRPEEYVNHSLYFEAKTFLQGLLLMEDKLSMAHGVETRIPFLDNDLVDFAMRLPVSTKLGNLKEIVQINENDPGPKVEKYYQKTRDGKLIIRKAMQQYVPEYIANGIKQGFSGPDASWFKGESIDYVRATLFNGHARIYDAMDKSATQTMVEDHLRGQVNRRLLIWSLLSVEEWFKQYVDS